MSAMPQSVPSRSVPAALSVGQPTTAIRLVQVFGLLVAALLVGLALLVGA
ncbi:hypothetical protein [Nocardioides sp. CFH 31398]|nr:hypothetical protein [Nocardioides sp. CFH 31398]MCH1865263.1 hypothetical protein [Nocardioides sp. CFH 31398]